MLKNLNASPCLITILLAVSLVLIAGPPALALQFDFGTGSYVDTEGTHDALEMVAVMNPDLEETFVDLEVGQTSSPVYFATLGTTETWINRDDLDPGQLTAHVDFDNPDLTPFVEGESIGFAGCFDFTQGWNIHWDDPVDVYFGNGGHFTLDLSDVGYTSWFWQGPDGTPCRPGTADVYATITYVSASVPDASVLLLLGPCLAALSIMGRRRKS